MRKKVLTLIAFSGALVISTAIIGHSSNFSLVAIGANQISSAEKNLTFSVSNTKKIANDWRYSTKATSADGNDFYLINVVPSNQTISNSMIFMPDGSNNSGYFYISDVENGLDSQGNDSYIQFQGLTSISMDVSGSTWVSYYISKTTTFPSQETQKVSVNTTNKTVSFGQNAHYVKFVANGALSTTTCSSLTLNYTCVNGGTIIDDPEVESLSLSGTYKTDFYTGDAFTHEGLVVTAHYDNGETEDVTSKASFSNPNMNTQGNKKITITYGDVSTSYYIYVTPAPTVTSLRLQNQTFNSNKNFNVGDEFSLRNIKVYATYSDSTEVEVTNDPNLSVTGYNMSQAGNQTVTVSFGGRSTTYTITVTKVLQSISLNTSNAKTEFEYNEAFDYSGVVVTAHYNDGSSSNVTASATFSTPNMATSGEQTITVAYNDKQTSYTITVAEKEDTGVDELVGTFVHSYFSLTFNADGTGYQTYGSSTMYFSWTHIDTTITLTRTSGDLGDFGSYRLFSSETTPNSTGNLNGDSLTIKTYNAFGGNNNRTLNRQ